RNRVSKRQVQHADVVHGSIVDDPLDAFDHRADVALSLLVQNADADQVCRPSDSVERAVELRTGRGRAIAGDHTRHVGTVPAEIILRIARAYEVHPLQNSRASLAAEILMVVDPAVDDGNGHSIAGEAELIESDPCSAGADGKLVFLYDGVILGHSGNERQS